MLGVGLSYRMESVSIWWNIDSHPENGPRSMPGWIFWSGKWRKDSQNTERGAALGYEYHIFANGTVHNEYVP